MKKIDTLKNFFKKNSIQNDTKLNENLNSLCDRGLNASGEELRNIEKILIQNRQYELLLKLAKFNPNADIHNIENCIIDSNDPNLCLKASIVNKNFNVNNLQQIILQSNNSHCMIEFAKNIAGANIVAIQKKLMQNHCTEEMLSLCTDTKFQSYIDTKLANDYFMNIDDAIILSKYIKNLPNLSDFQSECILQGKLKPLFYSLQKNKGISAEYCQELAIKSHDFEVCGLLTNSRFDVDRYALAQFVYSTNDIDNYYTYLHQLQNININDLNEFPSNKLITPILNGDNNEYIFNLAKDTPFVDKDIAGQKIIQNANGDYICAYASQIGIKDLTPYIDALIRLNDTKNLEKLKNAPTKSVPICKFDYDGKASSFFVNDRICDTAKIQRALNNAKNQNVCME